MYTTGFFLDSNFEAVKRICEFAKENNKPLGFNLSAVFILHIHWDNVVHALKYADYVFANEDEASAYAEKVGLNADQRIEAAKQIASSPKENQ